MTKPTFWPLSETPDNSDKFQYQHRLIIDECAYFFIGNTVQMLAIANFIDSSTGKDVRLEALIWVDYEEPVPAVYVDMHDNFNVTQIHSDGWQKEIAHIIQTHREVYVRPDDTPEINVERPGVPVLYKYTFAGKMCHVCIGEEHAVNARNYLRTVHKCDVDLQRLAWTTAAAQSADFVDIGQMYECRAWEYFDASAMGL